MPEYPPSPFDCGGLRVLNHDRWRPGFGYGMHGHENMEILSYVLDGTLEHKDSLGNAAVLLAGDVQVMTTGTGVEHSEYNHSATEPVEFLQIWIAPRYFGLPPSYRRQSFESSVKRGRLCPIATPDGREGSLRIWAKAWVYAALIDGEERIEYPVAPDRCVYVHVARGELAIDGEIIGTGVGKRVARQSSIALAGGRDSEILLIDLG